MNTEKIITFTLLNEGKRYRVQTMEHEYESLMCLISEYFPTRNFGICYGGGTCGTCGIRIKESMSATGCFMPSCEVKVDERLSNKIIQRL